MSVKLKIYLRLNLFFGSWNTANDSVQGRGATDRNKMNRHASQGVRKHVTWETQTPPLNLFDHITTNTTCLKHQQKYTQNRRHGRGQRHQWQYNN